MSDLVLSILSSTAILMLFKSFEKLEIPIFPAIIINYAMAFCLGVFVNGGNNGLAGFFQGSQANWMGFAMVLGLGLIAMFFMIGKSAQEAGISVTTVAGKISVVIPMVFSILYYGEAVTWIKVAGICLALAGLCCSVARDRTGPGEKSSWYLPLLLFLGLGAMDALVKLVQNDYLTEADAALFTGASFFFALGAGLLVSIARQVPLSVFMRAKVAVAGMLLGTANFGSIYFLINALNAGIFDSAALFGINSISIVVLSVFSARLFFKEQLSVLNWTGIGLALTAILFFMGA